MKHIYLFLLLSLSLSLHQTINAQRYWIGAVSAGWTNSANWSAVPGGPGGASVPGVNDQVFFDRVTPNPCILNATVTIQQLNLSAGLLSLSTSGQLTVTSNFQVQGGSLSAVPGGIIISNAPFNLLSGTVDLNGGSFNITNTFNMSGGTFSLGSGSFTSSGFFSLSNGVFNANTGTVNASNNVFSISGGTLNAGSAQFFFGNNLSIGAPNAVQPGTSTVTFNGAGQQDVIAIGTGISSKIVFHNLIINKPGNSQINFTTTSSIDTFQINNLLTLQAGRFTGSGFIAIERDVVTLPTFGGSGIPIACTGPNPSTVTLAAPLGVTGVSNFVGVLKSDPSVTVTVIRGPGNIDDTIRMGNFDARFIVRRGILQFPQNPPVLSRFRTIEIEPGGTLIAPQNFLYNAGEHINLGGTFIANGGTYVIYYPTLPNRTSLTTNNETFHHLIIDCQNQFGPGLDDTLTVTGDLIIRSGELQGEARSAFNVKGNVTYEAGALPSAGVTNMIFSGTIDQTLTFAATRIDAWNGSISVNKPSGELILGSPVVLDQFADGLGPRFFRFTRGIVRGSSTNYLSFKNQAVAYDASNLSYFDGPVQFQWFADFIFPIGDGGYYAPVKITTPNNELVTAQYIREDPGLTYDPAALENVANVSKREYWMISKAGTSNSVFISLSYDSARSGGISDPSALRVTRWTGSVWQSLGSQLEAGNFVRTSGPISSFSPFTLGSTDAILNPLPVHLVSFSGRAESGYNLLEWTVDNEENFDRYVIERSGDGTAYSSIGEVRGANDGRLHQYSFRDNSPLTRNFYRLKMVDIDGSFEYSTIVRVQQESVTELTMQVLPNPVRGDMKLAVTARESSSATVYIAGVGGAILRQQQVQVNRGMTVFNIATSNLSKGTYLVELRMDNGERRVMRFIVAD